MFNFIMRFATGIMRRSMAKSDYKVDSVTPLIGGITAYSDIPYIDDGNPLHLLDFYLPASHSLKSAPLPLIIDVHGGGLFYGDKSINKRFCYHLAKHGYSVASISYRLLPSVTFPEQVRDVTAAFRYIHKHAHNYGGDNKEVYLVGDSAGALLAHYGAALSHSAAIAAAFEDEGSPIREVGNFYISGLFDMHRRSMIKHLCKYSLGSKPERYPWYKYTYIDNINAEYIPTRAYLCSSLQDFLYSQTAYMRNILAQNNALCGVDIAPKRAIDGRKFDHVYPVRHPEWQESQELIKAALKSIKKG